MSPQLGPAADGVLSACSGRGRVLVPINFRLVAEEVSYIVEHSGARGAAGRPRARRRAAGVDVRAPLRASARRPTPSCYALRRRAASRGPPDEDATATINYTSGTTARPKGVQLTHRNIWLNAATFGWHIGRQRPRRLPAHAADVPLQRLGHAVRASPAWACSHIVLRKVDGAEILRRVEQHGVTLMCGAPAVVNRDPRRRGRRGTAQIPGRGRTRIVVAGAPPPTRTIERVETELGWEFIQIYGLTETAPLLTMNRGRAECDDLDARRAGRRAQSRPARRRSASASRIDDEGEVLARGNHRARGLLGAARGHGRRASTDGWFHTGDGGYDRRRRLPHDLRPQEGRDHLRRRERLVDRGRGRDLQPPGGGRGRGDRRARREVGRDW